MSFNELIPYIKVFFTLALFIGIPIFIAAINANYVKDSGKDDNNDNIQER